VTELWRGGIWCPRSISIFWLPGSADSRSWNAEVPQRTATPDGLSGCPVLGEQISRTAASPYSARSAGRQVVLMPDTYSVLRFDTFGVVVLSFSNYLSRGQKNA
jgi:hypothetical protein